MLFRIIALSIFLVAAWTGLQTLSSNRTMDSSPLAGVGPAPVPSIDDIVADRERRNRMSLEVESSASRPSLQTEDQERYRTDFTSAVVSEASRTVVFEEAGTARLFTPAYGGPAAPVVETRRTASGRYLVQTSHPRPWFDVLPGVTVGRILFDALQSGSFEHGHFIRPAFDNGEKLLHPAVRIWNAQVPEGVLILEGVFAESLSLHRAGRLQDPDLLPWSETPIWTSRANVGQALARRPAFRSMQTFAEYVTDPFSPLCMLMYPPPSHAPISMDSFFQRADEEREERVATEEAGLSTMEIRKSIFEATGHDLRIAQTFVLPVRFARDRNGSIVAVETMPGFMEIDASHLREDPFVIDGTTLTCRPQCQGRVSCSNSEREELRRSIHAVWPNLSVNSASGSRRTAESRLDLGVITGLSLLPDNVQSGFLTIGLARVTDRPDNAGMNVEYEVIWSPLRLDFMERDLMGFDGGYLGSYDFSEQSFYRLERSRSGNEITEKRVKMGGSR